MRSPTHIPAASYEAFLRSLRGIFPTHRLVAGYGNPAANVAVVGLQAAAGEQQPFREEPNVRVLEAMVSMGVGPDAVFTTYMLKDPATPREPEQFRLWGGYLSQELQLLNPRAVLLLGRDVFKWFTGIDNDIQKIRNTVFGYAAHSHNLFVTHAPEDLVVGEDTHREFMQDLTAVLRVDPLHFPKAVELPSVDRGVIARAGETGQSLHGREVVGG